MKKSTLLLLLAICNAPLFSQKFRSGEELLRAMHKKYYHGPCQCYTFSQRNTHYQKDSLTGNSEWHEKIRFPDFFRIDFGDTSKHNFVIFRNDSAINYKGGQVARSRRDSSSLLLILGGMYYRDWNDVASRLKAADFDLSKISSRVWIKKEAWVIGSAGAEDAGNQIWVSKDDFRVLRIMEKLSGDDIMDMRFEQHEKWCNGFVETVVSFRRNGELEQLEEYYNIKQCR